MRKRTTQVLLLLLLVFSWAVGSLEDFCLNSLNDEIEKLEIVSHYQKEERDILSLPHLAGTIVNGNNGTVSVGPRIS